MPPSTAVLPEPAHGLVPNVRKVAVLRANAIGDFVVAVPALEAVRRAYPDAEITYLGRRWHPDLLSGRPGPWDRVVAVPAYPGVTAGDDASPDTREVSEFLARQQAERYDLALQLHGGGGNSNAFVTRLGARVTAGSRDVDAPPLDRWTRYTHHQHEVLRFLEVVALVGAEPVRLEPRLTVTDADRLAGRQVLPPVGAPLVAIHPGATDPRRRWPAASFAAVADAVAERGGAVVIVGQGADDEAAAAGIRAATAVASPLDLVGRLSLSGMLGVLERCRLLVGNDSGPRHLAAAVGTATVAVYWCGNLINAGPLTRARHRIGVSFRTACPQCGADQTRSRCAHNPSFVADVPVADVVRDALELYDSEQARAAA